MKYNLIGENMQSLNVVLNEGESMYADAGKLIGKDQNVKMVPRLRGGIIGAIERKAGGASAFVTNFQVENGTGNGNVMFSGTIPGKIFPIELKEGEDFVAEDQAFLAAEDSVKFTIQTVRISAALFGGAGFILQKFVGPGYVFLHVAGNIVTYNLDGTKPLEIDPRHIAGFDSSLDYKITFVDNVRSAVFGGIGIFLAKFTGKGRVIAHTVSRYKLSSEIYQEGLEQSQQK
ncbi:MAG: TIGR00266 family protein [Candidatus Marsarchaeota archaeon]|jgi:uncharacterized protein (TIGR00266 family)|nr:TIGR00266 family protein [Candidatus Marsarchaeota archaeon]